MEHVTCNRCNRPILRLETYIEVGQTVLCDDCYMNMSTKEFLTTIGGRLLVKG